MNRNLPDIYRFYASRGGKLPKSLFKNILQDFNYHVMGEIIEDGYTFNMGHNLSSIRVKRIKRNYKKPVVNWKESLAYKQQLLSEGKQLWDGKQGEKWIIYYTDPWFCRFDWTKKHVKNASVYWFDASEGVKGNKERLSRFLSENKNAHLRYHSD